MSKNKITSTEHGVDPVCGQKSTVNILLPLGFHSLLSYRIPDKFSVYPGDFVEVPLGNRTVTGVVWDFPSTSCEHQKNLKEILRLHSLEPLSALMRQFIVWTAQYYADYPGNVLAMCMRAPLIFKPPKTEKRLHLTPQALAKRPRVTAAYLRVIEVLGRGTPLSSRDLLKRAEISPSVVRRLLEEGVLEQSVHEVYPSFVHRKKQVKPVPLTRAQEQATQTIIDKIEEHKFSVVVLDGVTGSGKTEVYLEAIAHVIAQNKQAVLLIPEIALTLSLVDRIGERLGFVPALWHSQTSPKERAKIWRGVSLGEVHCVVGARSALYLPWKDLGIVIVDEEHEQAFKQMDGVRYQARDMAVVLGSLGQFPVVLASATPSLETLVNIDRGKYSHVVLENRYNPKGTLPEIRLIDLRLHKLEKGCMISKELGEALHTTFESGEQALLFLNRRGYAPITLCHVCSHRVDCVNCSAALVEHRSKNVWLCHHCGYARPLSDICPNCQGQDTWITFGHGIERLEEEIKALFPNIPSIVLSSDRIEPTRLPEILSAIREGKYPLVLGTQLVAKGHHFPLMTLVGILDGDYILSTTDPRAAERTWQMLAQVSGRVGRGEKPGVAMIQTHQPDHPLLQAFLRSDREAFLQYEKKIRYSSGIPPFGRLASVILSSPTLLAVEHYARELGRRIPAYENVVFLGPALAPLAIREKRYRWRFLIKSDLNCNLAKCIQDWLALVPKNKNVKIDIDIDPYIFT